MPPFEFRGNRPQKRGKNKGQKPPPKPEFTFRMQRPKIAERPLLQGKRETTPEMLTDGASDKPAPKFASLDDLSDSEEAEMDLSEDSEEDKEEEEEEGEESRPRKRRAVAGDGTDNNAPIPVPAPAPPAPRWSNPDPYTALPPPDESQHKRLDVVKLIRKAKLQYDLAETKEKDAVTENEDFISLGATDDLVEKEHPPENAPKGPRSMQKNEPAPASKKRPREEDQRNLPPKTGRPAALNNWDGSIISQWMAFPGQNATPWVTEYPQHPGIRLHQEILDFYRWVRPQPFEQHVREDLVTRLDKLFRRKYGSVTVRPFGSFASGLYLPTADIDCVLLSRSFVSSQKKLFGEKKGQVFGFANFLRNSDMVVPGSVDAIAWARVPIIKFVDKLTGLRVDMSFDNDSGIIANGTFQEWKTEFPVMPVIVSVIKQFLLLRGLNEVPTGGLGGFAITCLVTSLLQHMPYDSKTWSVGSILLDFLNFYGNTFDLENVGIRMKPPGYFNKVYGNKDRLTIRDPNNRDNDISGGTREIKLIFRAFREAYSKLCRKMDSFAELENPRASILGAIIAANYDAYTEQRFQLRQVFETAEQFKSIRESLPAAAGI